MHRARFAFLLGGLCCSVRFTCLAAYVPMGIVLALREGSVSTLAFSKYLLSVCAIPGFCGVLVTLLVDRFFYGFWAIPFLGTIHFNVILGMFYSCLTSLVRRQLMFSPEVMLLSGNGSLYGTHPIHWYLTAGIPAITGVMLPFLVLCLFVKWAPGERNLWILCVCYIVAHSGSDHKEFRFMLPLLPVFCLISGKRMRDVMWRRSRRRVWMIAVAVINLFVFLYLGLVHQRGVVDVNLKIVELVKHEPQTYTIHYLMGCHSTPLLSHLHTPPIQFETWMLDCGPGCRANPKVECESELFEKNPEEFMENNYFHCSDLEEGTCVTDLRLFYPDFLVTRSEYLPKLKSRLATMGMKEVARFTNGINGINLPGDTILGSESCREGQSAKVSALLNITAICIDEIVLFKSKSIKPRY
jgi:phosphatidylinositol glycan class B